MHASVALTIHVTVLHQVHSSCLYHMSTIIIMCSIIADVQLKEFG